MESMADIYETLKNLSITYDIYNHPAVFTVEEADLVCTAIPGKQAKNLFLTNEKGTRHFLVTIAHDKRADLQKLALALGEKRLRFASPERLKKYLESISKIGRRPFPGLFERKARSFSGEYWMSFPEKIAPCSRRRTEMDADSSVKSYF